MSAIKPIWLPILVAKVPGLALLVAYFTFPEELAIVTEILLAITGFSMIAWVFLNKSKISRWSVRRASRQVRLSFVTAVVLTLLFFIIFNTVITVHTWSPEGKAVAILTPARVSVSPLKIKFPWIDCRENQFVCQPNEIRLAQSADEVGGLISFRGLDAIIIRKDSLYFVWAVVLLLCFTALTAVLVFLYSVAVIRHVDAGELFKRT